MKSGNLNFLEPSGPLRGLGWRSD